MADLRSYLAKVEGALFRPANPVSVVHQVTALQRALAEAGRWPPIRIDRPVLPGGEISDFPLVTNLFASRQMVAAMFGLDDHRGAARAFSKSLARQIPPRIIDQGPVPVQDVVEEGEDLDLRRLPALHQHELDVGRYLTAGLCITVDPETGIDNASLQRCWIKGRALTSYYPYAGSHNARNIAKYRAAGEACPIAVAIGHHPAVVVGANAKLGYPESHWGAAGGLLGEALRLAPSVTHGDKLMVPADAEFVIEGWVPAARLEADGPFGEYTGYVGPQVATLVIEVTCMTRRTDAVYHEFGAGLEDHLIPENMAMEGKIFSLVKSVAPSLVNVHVPFSGRRFHAYLQFREPPPGEVRDGLTAALAYRRLRTVMAVDDDIDIFDDGQVLWALSTRVQWHRDAIRIDGLSHGNLDPSLPPGASTVTKQGIDATLPARAAPGKPRPCAPSLSIGPEFMDQARALIAETDGP